MKGIVNRLSDLVADVRNTTESITTATQQVAAGNSGLSQRTEEQGRGFAVVAREAREDKDADWKEF